MANKYKKFVASAATATLVASAIVPVASANEASFTDIGGYAQDTQDKINSLVERGIVNGTSETTFNPTAPIKRSQVVKLLGRYLVEELGEEIPEDWNTKARFTDVELTKDQELSKYAAVVFDAGVFTGNNGALEGSKEISRQNMAVVLDRAAEAITGTSLVDYAAELELEGEVTDLATAKESAQEVINALNALEVSTATEFKPLNNVSRANFATFLYNAIEVIAEMNEVTEDVNPLVALEEAMAALPTEVTDIEATEAAVETAQTELDAAIEAELVTEEEAAEFQATIDEATAAIATAKDAAITAELEAAIAALPTEVTATTAEEAQTLVDAATAALTAATELVTEEEAKTAQTAIDQAQAAIEATKTLVATSVKSLNATQVEVTFSKKVEKTTAETAANYVFTSLDGVTASAAQTAKLAEDGKSVIVTFDKALSKRYQVKVAAVKDADNANETVSYDEIVTIAADVTAPTISGTERISSNKVKVNFSEPVTGNATAITAKYADGTAIVGLSALAVNKQNELIVDLSAATVTVDKEIIITFNGVIDTNSNLLTPQPATVSVKKETADGIAPELTAVTQTAAKEFTIDFSKELDGFAFTTSGTEVAVSGNTVTAIEKVTASQYKVKVTGNLDGLQTVTVKTGKAKDAAGQANTTDLTKLVTFKKDVAAPVATAKLVVGKDNKEYVELTFDKDVTVGAVAINGSSVKDYVTTEIATAVAATAVYADTTAKDKKVVLVPLTATALTTEGATYNLKITSAAIKSDAGEVMAETAVTFTRGKDGVATVSNTDVVSAVAVAQGATPDVLTATFTMPTGAKLDGATATALANYTIAGAEVESISLAASTVATATTDTQVVTLKLKAGSNTFTGVRNITVKDVKVSGSTKVMESVTINNVSIKENVRPTVVGAEISAANQITVTFSEAMSVEKLGSFLVKAGTATVAQAAIGATVNPLDATKVVIVLNAAITTEQLAETITVEPIAVNGKVDTANFKVKDASGNYLEVFSPVTIVKP